MDVDDRYDGSDNPPYGPADEINPSALPAALRGLTLFGGDPYLSMQATNLGLVDRFCSQLESNLMRSQVEQDTTPLLEATFLGAQSQMWIFAAYEALRTWRQRARDVLKWSQNGGLPAKIIELRKDVGFRHYGRTMRADQLQEFLASPNKTKLVEDDLRRVHMTFERMHMLRVALAKHEVGGQRNSLAYAPGYGRINMWCGAIDYELSVGPAILGTINRRDIADEIRAFAAMERVPSDQEIAGFDKMMRGPPESTFDPPPSPA